MIASTEPFEPLAAWIRDAIAAEPDVPDAMQVASVGPDGRPSLRTVLLKHHGPDGLVFYTNLGSRKGAELTAHPHVALLLHWKSLQRQLIAEGPVEPVSSADADAYWASRPRGSQIGGWASLQSQPLPARAVLEARVAEIETRYADRPVPRPPHWSGFRCRPTRVEFWQGRPDRLHERVVYTLADGRWTRGALFP